MYGGVARCENPVHGVTPTNISDYLLGDGAVRDMIGKRVRGNHLLILRFWVHGRDCTEKMGQYYINREMRGNTTFYIFCELHRNLVHGFV